MPAISVLPVASVGSSARLAIDSEACLSVSDDHVVPPLFVTQTPPFADPTKIVFAPKAGFGTTA
jgi:hypothetical protein